MISSDVNQIEETSKHKEEDDNIDGNADENYNDYYSVSEEFKINLDEKIGNGSFGQIYKCINIKTKKEYAAKIESNSTTIPLLAHEYKMYKLLEGGTGIPTVAFFNNQGVDTVLIIDLLGPNLEDIMQDTKEKKFSLKTTLMIADQILSRLNFIHELGILYRDIKPENFLVGNSLRETLIYIIDFGLARKYIDPKTNMHIPFKENRAIAGTARYISINVHKGYEQGRRDDLISLCYMMLYFLKGELPWDSVKAKARDEKYKKIYDIKVQLDPDKLTTDFPVEIKILFEYIFELQFQDKPNYAYMKSMINKAIEHLGTCNDMAFDWMFIELLEVPIFMIKEEKQKKEIERMRKALLDSRKESDKEKNNKGKNNSSNNIEMKKEVKFVKGRGSFNSSFTKKNSFGIDSSSSNNSTAMKFDKTKSFGYHPNKIKIQNNNNNK